MAASIAVPNGWRIHDYLVGILGGGGLGAVLGVFLAGRVLPDGVSTPLVLAVTAVLGALPGIALMRETRKSHDGFWTVTTVVMWVVAIASAVFLTLLYKAILGLT